MSEKVSAFWPIHIGEFEYLFFIVNWNDYSSTISESLSTNLKQFGIDLELRGKVVEAYSHKKGETFQEIRKKNNWPVTMSKRFDDEQFPFMLIINESFQDFNPGEHCWAIIWFSDFVDDNNCIPNIFCSIIKTIRQERNLFKYFEHLARDKKIKKLTEYFEIKPGIFGCSIDVKAIIKDMGKKFK